LHRKEARPLQLHGCLKKQQHLCSCKEAASEKKQQHFQLQKLEKCCILCSTFAAINAATFPAAIAAGILLLKEQHISCSFTLLLGKQQH
jgi:hypothetical protein